MAGFSGSSSRERDFFFLLIIVRSTEGYVRVDKGTRRGVGSGEYEYYTHLILPLQ